MTDITFKDVLAVLVAASKGDGRVQLSSCETYATIKLGYWHIELFVDAGDLDYVEVATHRDDSREFQSFYDEKSICPLDLLDDELEKALLKRIMATRFRPCIDT